MANLVERCRKNAFLVEEFNWKYLRSFAGHLNVATIVSVCLLTYLDIVKEVFYLNFTLCITPTKRILPN